MDKNNSYFILSGFISLSLFFIVVLLFFYMMFIDKENKIYALKKDKFISVSIVMPKESAKVSTKKSSTAIQTKTPKTKSQDIDVNDLFSDVWTQKITHKKKKKINAKRIQDIAKKIKTAKKNSVNPISEKIEKLDTQSF